MINKAYFVATRDWFEMVDDENGSFQVESAVPRIAVEHGDLELLKRLKATSTIRKWQFTDEVLWSAAALGSVEMLEWLLGDNGATTTDV